MVMIPDETKSNPDQKKSNFDLILTNAKGGLGKLRYTNISYGQNRWEQALVSSDQDQQFESFKNANVSIPDNGAYEFPSSLYNMLFNMESDLDTSHEDMIKKYALEIPNIDSSFTKRVLTFDLDVFEEAEKKDLGEQTPLPPAKTQGYRGITKLYGKKASLKYEEFTTSGCPKFRDVRQYRGCLSLQIGKSPPINILLGEDDIIGKATDDKHSTIRHEVTLNEVQKDLKSMGFNESKISKDLKDSEYRDPILYFWRNYMINPGYVYWLIKDDGILILHDLTSSFNMKPIDNINAADVLKNFNNAIGLLYYKTSMNRYLHEDRTALYGEIIELALRAISLLQAEQYPMIYILTNLICSNTFILPDIEINYPEIIHKCVTNKFVFESVDSCMPAFKDMEYVVACSLTHLKRNINLLSTHLMDTGLIPLVDNEMTPEAKSMDLRTDCFVEALLNLKAKEFEVKDYENVLTAVLSKSLEIRLLIYCLRKQFLDCSVQAMIYHKNERNASAFLFNDAALSTWIAMVSFWSPDKEFPLPLEPMFMLGDLFYRFSYDAKVITRTLDKYGKNYNQPMKDLLQGITTVTDKRFSIKFEKAWTCLQYCMKSFECFAQCIVSTNEAPKDNLLKRLCVVANSLALSHLQVCTDQHLTNETMKLHFKRSKSFIDLVQTLIRQTNSEVSKKLKIILCASFNKVKYMRININFSTNSYADLRFLTGQFNEVMGNYKKVKCYYRDQAISDEDLVEDIITKLMIEARFEYIWLLKGMEFKEKISRHREILKEFEEVIELCNGRYNSEKHADYFREKGSILCACIAEYLFVIYKDFKSDKIKDEAEFWFDQANTRFTILNRQMELLKSTADRIIFYESILLDVNQVHEFDQKAIKLLINCQDQLINLQNSDLYENPEDLSAKDTLYLSRRRVKMNGVLKAFRNALIGMLDKRCHHNSKCDGNAGKVCGTMKTMFKKCSNVDRTNVLNNLIETLDIMGEQHRVK